MKSKENADAAEIYLRSYQLRQPTFEEVLVVADDIYGAEQLLEENEHEALSHRQRADLIHREATLLSVEDLRDWGTTPFSSNHPPQQQTSSTKITTRPQGVVRDAIETNRSGRRTVGYE
jgi:hypothetical protein